MEIMVKEATIKTRFIVISDTHGKPLTLPNLTPKADIAIHCGDLTEHSSIKEMSETLQLLRDIDAPVKVAIAGNHDFTLDTRIFEKKLEEADRIAGERLDRNLVKEEFGDFGAAKKLLQQAKEDGIMFLEEGTHRLSLNNGAHITLYTSPYTPSNDGLWAYQYNGTDHSFDIQPGTSVVITHGPPQGVLDRTSHRKRIGCPQLFAAVAKTQPLLHCFGHVHNGWGAKLVTWRTPISEHPCHFSDIDNARSLLLDSLASRGGEIDASGNTSSDPSQYREAHHSSEDEHPLGSGKTLFINASIQGEGDTRQLPWVVDVDLPLKEE